MNARPRRGLLPSCLLPLCLAAFSALAHADVPADDSDPLAADYPVVITPTRLRQSLAEVPASVTVITAETIRRYGITSIPDALRLVPGMAVTRSQGHDYRITYHGTSVVTPRRMNVLIDGVSIYRPGLSRVEWGSLPVALEDVDRIEVTRGPDSSSYGPNSMMSVVNILTRRPRDVEHALVWGAWGSRHIGEAGVRLGTRLGEHTQLSVTGTTERDGGYDDSTVPGGAHDGIRVKRLNVRSETALGERSSLELQANVMGVAKEFTYTGDPFAVSYPDERRYEGQVSGKFTTALSNRHELQLRAYYHHDDSKEDWRTCWPRIALHPVIGELAKSYPDLAALIAHGGGLIPTASQLQILLDPRLLSAVADLGGFQQALMPSCGMSNNNFDETRTQIELQDTYVLSDELRFVTGAGARVQEAHSQVYFTGRVRNEVRWVFAHGEWRATPALTFNVGGYGESNSLGPQTFSPRLAANYKLSDEQAVRAVYSRGTRTPDLLESRGHWTPLMTDIDPPVLGATTAAPLTVMLGNPNLTEERITSMELGYLIALRRLGLTIDTRVFSDRLSNLISDYSERTQLQANNDARVRLAGAETQVNWDFSDGWSGWLGYSYLVNYQASNIVEASQWSRHSGAMGLSKAFQERWRASLSTYLSSGDGVAESGYARADLTLARELRIADQPASAMVVLSYLHTPEVTTYLRSMGYFLSRYQDRLGLYGKMRVAF